MDQHVMIYSRGYGKSYEAMKRMGLTPQEYQKSIENFDKILEEAKNRSEQQKQLQWLLWYLYYKEEGLFY